MRGRVVLGASGGIAAYKVPELLRELQRCGCAVRAVLTRHASEFVQPRTLAVLSGFPVEVDQWQRPTEPGVDHVAVSHWSDLLLIAPATANLLAKMAAGIADDALTTYCLAHRRRILVAPAMNTVMWRQPAVQGALELLRRREVEVVDPDAGYLACGDEGEGRMATIPVIVDRALRLLPPRGALAGLRLLVSAGPTRERVDLVRVLTNRSSGRMGVALAVAARDLGARVTLLHGPLALPLPAGVDALAVDSAEEMGAALDRLAPEHDAALLAAAVADFRPAAAAAGKLDRRAGGAALALEPVPDLAAAVGARAGGPYLVVFAAEDGPDEERARRKMTAKGAHAVVLNDVSGSGVGMEAPENEALVLTAAGNRWPVPRAAKETVAREILLRLAGEILAHRR